MIETDRRMWGTEILSMERTTWTAWLTLLFTVFFVLQTLFIIQSMRQTQTSTHFVWVSNPFNTKSNTHEKLLEVYFVPVAFTFMFLFFISHHEFVWKDSMMNIPDDANGLSTSFIRRKQRQLHFFTQLFPFILFFQRTLPFLGNRYHRESMMMMVFIF